jgi:hypothetical protein
VVAEGHVEDISQKPEVEVGDKCAKGHWEAKDLKTMPISDASCKDYVGPKIFR